jgi:hypothetical protein
MPFSFLISLHCNLVGSGSVVVVPLSVHVRPSVSDGGGGGSHNSDDDAFLRRWTRTNNWLTVFSLSFSLSLSLSLSLYLSVMIKTVCTIFSLFQISTSGLIVAAEPERFSVWEMQHSLVIPTQICGYNCSFCKTNILHFASKRSNSW